MTGLALAWTACCGPAAVRADGRTPRRVITVPYVPLAGHGAPLVRVRLNDRTDATFLLDTGSNVSLLTDAAAAQLGLAPTPLVVGGHLRLLGGEPADAVTVSRARLDGTLGMDALASLAFALDGPRRRLTVWRPGGLPAGEVRRAGFGNAAAVPLTDPHGDGPFSVTAKCRNGRAVAWEALVVDTGANSTILSARAARQLGLWSREREGNATLSGGAQSVDMARVSQVLLGALALKDLLVGYRDPNAPSAPALGMDVLSRGPVVLDFPGRKADFRAGGPPKREHR